METHRRAVEMVGVALAVVAAGVAAVAPGVGAAACPGAGAGVALAIAGAGPGRRRLPAWGAVAALLAMSGVSLWVTQTPEATWARVWQLWTGLGMFWALAVWARTRCRLALLGAGLAGAGGALALASPFVVEWFTERKTFFPPSVYEAFPRLVSDTVHPNVMAGALLGVIFIAIAWALKPPTASDGGVVFRWVARARGLWALAALLMLLVLFLTKSRGAWAAFLFGCLVLAVLMARRRAAVAAALLGVALAVLAALWVGQGATPGALRDSEILDTSTFVFRQRMWHYALLLVGDFPLTGVGMGGFNTALADLYGYSAFAQPSAHNLYLQAALDLGLPGLAAFLALTVAAFARAGVGLRRMRAAGDDLWPLAAGGMAGLAAVLGQGMVDITVWSTKGAVVLWGLLALLYGLGSATQWVAPDGCTRE